jgi:hypothetical protein
MRRPRLLLRYAFAVLLAAVLLGNAQSSQARDYEWYPGLPDASFGNWTNASQGGMSYAKRAQQWFVTPMAMTTAEFINEQNPDRPGDMWVRAEGYFISPKGAPDNYGYLEPMTVRSAGFGLMPVEATVQISQRRKNGYPVPVRVKLGANYTYTPDGNGGSARVDIEYPSVTIKDSFNVRILSVRVDGVDVGLTGDCRTTAPAPVTMRSPRFVRDDIQGKVEADWFRGRDPSSYFHPYYGGQLTGTMTIPPFTGCTTKSGDDMSGLMTVSASGQGNTVIARAGWPCPFAQGGSVTPAPPGVSNPGLGGGHAPSPELDPRYCPGVQPFEYPRRGER